MNNDNIPEEIGSNFLKNALTKNIKEKIDWGKLMEGATPYKTKWRIMNGQRVVDYKRDILSPEVDDSEVVLQSTYSLAGKDFGKRYLVTFGAGPCVVATLYDPSSKTGAMVHFDNRSNVIVAMREIEKRLGGNPQDWQLRIVGGHKKNESSGEIIKDLRSKAAFSKIHITEEDILEEAALRKDISVALDTQTGELLDLPTNYTDNFTQEQKDTMGKKLGQIVSDPMISIGKVEFVPNLLGKK